MIGTLTLIAATASLKEAIFHVPAQPSEQRLLLTVICSTSTHRFAPRYVCLAPETSSN
jgi:hypothetical protein